MFSYLFLFIFPFILFSYFFPFFTSTIMLICIFFYINASHMLRNKVNSIHKSFFTCFYLISKYLLACIEIDILHCHTYLQVLFIHLLYGGSKKKFLFYQCEFYTVVFLYDFAYPVKFSRLLVTYFVIYDDKCIKKLWRPISQNYVFSR